MRDALVAGTTDPEMLAELARGSLHRRSRRCKALEGRFDPLHAVLIGAILQHLDFLNGQIDRLSDAIEQLMRPFDRRLNCFARSPASKADRGEPDRRDRIDMTVFPTARARASWAGQCPGNDHSAGKRRSERHKGGKQLNEALTDAAMAARVPRTATCKRYTAGSTPTSATARLGAVKHSMINASWYMLTTSKLYNDAGGDTSPGATRTPDPTAHRPARTARTHRHPPRRAPGSLNAALSEQPFNAKQAQPQASFSRCMIKTIYGELAQAGTGVPSVWIGGLAVSVIVWLVIVVVVVVLVVAIGVFVRRRRRGGGVIATRRKR